MVCKCGAQNRRADSKVQALLKCSECGRIVVLYDLPEQTIKTKTKDSSGPVPSAFKPPPGTVFCEGDTPPWDDSLSSEWK